MGVCLIAREFGFGIDDRFDTSHGCLWAITFPHCLRRHPYLLRFRYVPKQPGIKKVDGGFGEEKLNLGLLRLIPEETAGRQKNEGEDQNHNQVVLPTPAREVPEDESLDAGH